MGSIARYLEDAILDFVLSGTSLGVPTDIYIGLSTADPTNDGSGIAEPSGGSYARVIANSWTTAAGRETRNSSAVVFPTATGSWGTITHWFAKDAASGGNMLAFGALSSPSSLAIVSGKTARFPANQLVVEYVSGGVSDYLAHKTLDHVFKVAPYTPPTNKYLGLSTQDPLDDASDLDEPAGGSYARVLVNSWAASVAGVKATSAVVSFAVASGSWGTLTHGCIFGHVSAGNLLFYAALGSPQSVAAGEYPEYASGAYSVTLT